MSTRIPFAQVFRGPPSSDANAPVDLDDPAAFEPRDITPPPRGRQLNPNSSTNAFDTPPASSLKMASSSFQPSTRNANTIAGTRSPQLLEYERQAQARQREQDVMAQERAAMAEREAGMQREKERIEQEEYEMKRYYEAEALKHEEMVRAHREVVKRFEEEVRRFERRRKDHEASSEAFARVIAMPVQRGSGRQESLSAEGPSGTNRVRNGSTGSDPFGGGN